MSAAPAQPWPPARIAWTTLGVLALVRLSAQLDLGILSLLVQPIKKDLGLSDGQVGLLLGFAFAIFYLALGVPLAALVDRYSRRSILAVGITVWSLMTALSGAAQNFWQLFACRVGVGAGESVNGPATYSMIADLFPRERLPRAIAVINLGSYAGIGLSLLLGAVVIQALSNVEMPTLPVLGKVRLWQMVFFLVGLPGLVLAAIMLRLPEPVRRRRPEEAEVGTSFAAVMRLTRANWRFFLPIFLGVALGGIESGGAQMWRPAFFERSYGWTPQQAGLWIGTSALIAAPVGLLVGAWLAERFARGRDDANMRVVVIAWTLTIPFAVIGPLLASPWLALAASAVTGLLGAMTAPTQNAAMQSVTPNAMRGKLTALYLLTYVLAAQGIGPSFIAFWTEYVVRDEAGLRYAMAGSAAVVMPLAVVTMLLGLKPYGREIARIKAKEAAEL